MGRHDCNNDNYTQAYMHMCVHMHACINLYSQLVLGAGGYILTDLYNTTVTYLMFSAALYKEQCG